MSDALKPCNPERDGRHWLWRASQGYVLHYWRASERQYLGNGDAFGPDWAQGRWRYCGPVHTPSEIATLTASAWQAGWAAGREAAAEAQPCTAENPYETDYHRGHFDAVMQYGKAIRALPVPPPPERE